MINPGSSFREPRKLVVMPCGTSDCGRCWRIETRRCQVIAGRPRVRALAGEYLGHIGVRGGAHDERIRIWTDVGGLGTGVLCYRALLALGGDPARWVSKVREAAQSKLPTAIGGGPWLEAQSSSSGVGQLIQRTAEPGFG